MSPKMVLKGFCCQWWIISKGKISTTVNRTLITLNALIEHFNVFYPRTCHGSVPFPLTVESGMLRAVTQVWKVSVRIGGRLLLRVLLVPPVHLVVVDFPRVLEQRVLAFTESQYYVNAVDPAPATQTHTLWHVVVVQATIVHHTEGIHWQMHPRGCSSSCWGKNNVGMSNKLQSGGQKVRLSQRWVVCPRHSGVNAWGLGEQPSSSLTSEKLKEKCPRLYVVSCNRKMGKIRNSLGEIIMGNVTKSIKVTTMMACMISTII